MTAEILTLARSEEGCDKEILVRKMERLGVPVTRSTRVRRAEDSFAKALSRALESSDIVLLSGGLRDGFAADMLCRGLGLSARVHREGLLLLARARRKNPEKLPEEDLRRVHIPREAKGFCNPVTLCSAFVLQAGDQCILALPEDEESLEAVWENGAGAYLKGFLGQNGAPAPAEGAQSGDASAGAKEAPAKEDREESATLPSGMQKEKRTGFWGRMLPRRGDPPREKVRKGVFLLCVLVFLSSAGYLASYYWQAHANREQTKELEELYAQGSSEQLPAGYPADYLPKFAALWEVNPDLAGWLSIEGTQLSYPVVQTGDNDYYLRRDFLQKHNKHGIPMVDYRVGLKEPSDNIVIYGHNMKDGQMFGELLGYRNLDFYREHPVITFDSVYREAQYKIISVFITNAYEAQGPVFDYHNFIDAYGDSRTFGEFIQGVRVRSLINTPVDVQQGDKLLTLSTCDYSFKDSRFVVVARQLRPGESADVAVEQAQVNPNPVMPQAYYQGEGEAPVSPPYEEPESIESSSGSSSEE
ncbi:MAG: class B sortase, partial [Oscillospiraceae bacterium]|nr:class B sortase [Oscillospiraceae bacterium]